MVDIMQFTVRLLTAAIFTLQAGGCWEGSSDTITTPPCDEGPKCYDDTFTYLGGYRETDCQAAWSPDGSTIAYFHGGITDLGDTSGIYFVTPEGAENRLFLAGFNFHPDWSPNGEWLAFTSGGGLRRIRVDGTEGALISASPDGQYCPDWSPGGQLIVFSSHAGGSRGVWVVPWDSDDPSLSRRLIFPGQDPSWSNNGQEIVFKGYLDEGSGICIMDTSGTEAHLLYGEEYGTARDPTFSPDDSKIAFSYSVPGHVSQIWVMDADGSEPKQLTTCGGMDPAWSPDGQHIVYTDTRICSGRLWMMNADGSCKKQITRAEWWTRRQ